MARAAALGVVVLGHLTLAVIDRGPDGELRGTNLLALRPGWLWVGVLSPMPAFFAAAGWANAGNGLRAAAPRLRSLVGLCATVVAAWSALLVATWAITGEGGVVADGARLATQPFWFLAAYVPFAAAGPVIDRMASRPLLTAAVALGTIAALDAARFLGDAPLDVGWPNFFLAWSLPWMAGVAWRRRHEAGHRDEGRLGAALLVVGVIVSVLLVERAGYSPALIDAVPGRRSNTTPPSLYTAVAALTQVGALMVGARWLDAVARRWARPWRRAGAVAVSVYALHLTALTLCAAAIALGVPVPRRLTAAFWWSRPLWAAAVLAVTAALAWLAAAIRTRIARSGERGTGPATWSLVSGVVLAAAGGALVGLRGPRTPLLATLCTAAFIGSWLLLRDRAAEG